MFYTYAHYERWLEKKTMATHNSSLLTILLLPPSPTSLLPPNLHHHHRECYAHAHVHYAHPKTITNITTTINKNQATTNITTAMRARIDGTPPAWSDHNIPSPLKLHPFRFQKKDISDYTFFHTELIVVSRYISKVERLHSMDVLLNTL